MTYYEKIEWLRRYQAAVRESRLLEDEYWAIKAEAERVTPILKDTPGGGGSVDKLAKAVERMDDALDALAAQLHACEIIRAQVKLVCACVPDLKHREILRRRYLLGESWAQLATALGKDERGLRREHRRAVEALDEVFKNIEASP